MRVRTDILYGSKTGNIDKDVYVELFMNDDGKVGINCNSKGQGDVFQDFKIKDIALYDEFLTIIKNKIAENEWTEYEDILDFMVDSIQSEDYDKYIDYDYFVEMRTEDEINEYMDEAFDRVWLVRTQNMFANMLEGKESISQDVLDSCLKSVDNVCKKYNIDFKESVCDWDYGYWSGILAALRWVMGDEKDFLDT